MADKEKFEKEALADFIEMTGIPKEKIVQYGKVDRFEFHTLCETCECKLKTSGLAVTLYACSSPILYFPKKHKDDISEPVKDQLPCEDAISRKEAIDTIRQLYLDLASQKAVIDILKVLPSVTPQEPNCSEIPTGSITKNCRSCKNFGSHHGICEICKDNKCWTEKEPTKNDLGVDCINRAELLKAMGTWDKFGNDSNEGLIPLRTPALQDRYVPYVKYDDMVKCVKGIPSVTPQESRWIPVSERLPEKGYSVLVTRIIDDNCKYVRIASYQGDCWMDNTDEFNKPNPHKVIAWQSLSPCYEPQESEE